MAAGMPTVQQLLEPRYYSTLPGGLLEALGRLFTGPVRLYVYPRKEANEKLITTENIPVPENLRHLLAHLWANHLIEDLQGVNFSNLDILYKDLLKKIGSGDPVWETMVPAAVRDIIKSRKYFGYGSGSKG